MSREPSIERAVPDERRFSGVEHDGMGRYRDPMNPDGDLAAVREMALCLRPGGVLLLAVPTCARDTLFFVKERRGILCPAAGDTNWVPKSLHRQEGPLAPSYQLQLIQLPPLIQFQRCTHEHLRIMLQN